MIEIKRTGTKVELDMTTYVPNYDNRTFQFFWECGGELLAGLLTGHLIDALWKEVKEIRNEAYERGWSDAKSKKAKATYHSGRV